VVFRAKGFGNFLLTTENLASKACIQSHPENLGGLGQIRNMGPLALTDIGLHAKHADLGACPLRKFLKIASSEFECKYHEPQ